MRKPVLILQGTRDIQVGVEDAERLRTDVISDNIANASTTRTQDGGAFRRSRVVLSQKENGIDWRTPFTPEEIERGPGKGVKVMSVEKDNSELSEAAVTTLLRGLAAHPRVLADTKKRRQR